MASSSSASKQKILSEINQSLNQPIPLNVKMIHDRAYLQSFNLKQKFRNLQDPLGFIHNNHIQNLVDKTEETSSKLKRQMDEISEFSKSMYKKIIAREGNEFNFENIHQQSQHLEKTEIQDADIIKAQKQCQKKGTGEKSKTGEKHQIKAKETQKSHKAHGVMHYRHQPQQVMETKRQTSKIQLNFSHIKLLDSPQFDTHYRNLQFFDMLKQQKKNHHHLSNQPFDIESSAPVEKMSQKINFPLVEESFEYSSNSHLLFYDFQRNLKFWRQAATKSAGINGVEARKEVEKLTDETILSTFNEFNKKEISVNNICDLAMGKLTIEMLRYYLTLKKQHKTKTRPGKHDENLQEMYHQLKKEYEYAHELKMKLKSQRIPVKYVDTDCQTIRILEQKDFDDYFCEDVRRLFEKIAKLSKIREKAMVSKTMNNRFVLIKNACIDISEHLFKLLTLVLKGEKFYPRQRQNEKHFAPFFTYNDLFDLENREEVEKKILELIYSKVTEFQCDMVDGFHKSQLIRLYIEERETNARILEIVEEL